MGTVYMIEKNEVFQSSTPVPSWECMAIDIKETNTKVYFKDSINNEYESLQEKFNISPGVSMVSFKRTGFDDGIYRYKAIKENTLECDLQNYMAWIFSESVFREEKNIIIKNKLMKPFMNYDAKDVDLIDDPSIKVHNTIFSESHPTSIPFIKGLKKKYFNEFNNLEIDDEKLINTKYRMSKPTQIKFNK